MLYSCMVSGRNCIIYCDIAHGKKCYNFNGLIYMVQGINGITCDKIQNRKYVSCVVWSKEGMLHFLH